MPKMSVKDDLSALYRLEFYRRQKNWKFYKPKQNKPTTPPKSNKKSINITYDIEDDEAHGSSDPHNKAFLDLTPERPKNKNLTTEWLIPVSIPPTKEFINKQTSSEALFKKGLSALKTYLNSYAANENVQNGFKEAQEWKETVLGQKIYKNHMEAEDLVDGIMVEEFYDFEAQERKETVLGEKVYEDPMEAEDLPDGIMAEEFYDFGGDLDLAGAGSSHGSCEYPQPSQFGDQGDNAMTQMSDCNNWSVDSEGEFLRGVDAAPHSSMLDIALPDCNCAEVSYKDLSRLSSQQLAAASQHHQQALHKIQQELGLRQSLRRSVSLYTDCCSTDLPTQDVERDVIVAGSHLQHMRVLREERAEYKRRMINESLKSFT